MKVAGKNGSSLEEIYQGQEEKWIGSKMKLARAYGWVVSSLVRSLKKSTCSRTLPISPKSSSCTQSNPTLGWSPCDFCSTCCSTLAFPFLESCAFFWLAALFTQKSQLWKTLLFPLYQK
jgi:hypothetical protein